MECNIKSGTMVVSNIIGVSDTQSQQHPSDDSITAVFSELKCCTWFNYQLFQFILKVKGNEAEKVFLITCVDELFIPYMKHSVFEGKDIRKHYPPHNQHHLQHASIHIKGFVSKDLYEASHESIAIKYNIAQ